MNAKRIVALACAMCAAGALFAADEPAKGAAKDDKGAAAAAPAKPKKKPPKKKPVYNKIKEALAVAQAWEQPIMFVTYTSDSKYKDFFRQNFQMCKPFMKDFADKNFILCLYQARKDKKTDAVEFQKIKDELERKVLMTACSGSYREGVSFISPDGNLSYLSDDEIPKYEPMMGIGAWADTIVQMIGTKGVKFEISPEFEKFMRTPPKEKKKK